MEVEDMNPNQGKYQMDTTHTLYISPFELVQLI